MFLISVLLWSTVTYTPHLPTTSPAGLSWAVLGLSQVACGALGALLGRFGILRDPLGALWKLSQHVMGRLGPAWGSLGALLNRLGALLGRVGSFWSLLGL